MSKASKPTAVDISKVHDAIAVLKSRGVPCYRTDIARYTGLSLARVDRVLAHDEGVAASNPKGKITMRWNRLAGQTGKAGIALNDRDRRIAAEQRDKAIDSQLIHHASRRRAEYLRTPDIEPKAVAWAWAVRRVGVADFALVRAEIDQVHTEAMSLLVDAGKLGFAEAFKRHYDLMAEIDAL